MFINKQNWRHWGTVNPHIQVKIVPAATTECSEATGSCRMEHVHTVLRKFSISFRRHSEIGSLSWTLAFTGHGVE